MQIYLWQYQQNDIELAQAGSPTREKAVAEKGFPNQGLGFIYGSDRLLRETAESS